MKRLSTLFAIVASLTIAGSVLAASTLVTQTNGLGFASVSSPTSATIGVVGSGGTGSALVYVRGKSTAAGKLLADVHFSATVAAGGTVAGGAPRLTVPIDTNGDGKWDDFATITWNSCGGTATNGSTLDIAVTMSTDGSTCGVTLNYAGTSFSNWADLATQHPTWRVASGATSRPFVIVDWAPTNVDLTGIDLS